MLIAPDPSVEDMVLEDPFPLSLVVPTAKSSLERWLLGLILLSQQALGLKGLKMPTIELTITGTDLKKQQVLDALPKGANLTAWDEGNEAINCRFESDDPLAAIIGLEAVVVDVSLMEKIKAAFSKDELCSMLKAAGVERNGAGTTVSANMSESELICLLAKASGLEALRDLVGEDEPVEVGGKEGVALVDGGGDGGEQPPAGGEGGDAGEGTGQQDDPTGGQSDGDSGQEGDGDAGDQPPADEPPVG